MSTLLTIILLTGFCTYIIIQSVIYCLDEISKTGNDDGKKVDVLVKEQVLFDQGLLSRQKLKEAIRELLIVKADFLATEEMVNADPAKIFNKTAAFKKYLAQVKLEDSVDELLAWKHASDSIYF